MGYKESAIRQYLDEKGIDKNKKGYYYLEKAISLSIENPLLSCKENLSQLCNGELITENEASVYSTICYVLKRSNTKEVKVNRFIKTAAHELATKI